MAESAGRPPASGCPSDLHGVEPPSTRGAVVAALHGSVADGPVVDWAVDSAARLGHRFGRSRPRMRLRSARLQEPCIKARGWTRSCAFTRARFLIGPRAGKVAAPGHWHRRAARHLGEDRRQPHPAHL